MIETGFDLNNPPNFDLDKLFSIDALVRIGTQGSYYDYYQVIHRLPFEDYSKGGIFVLPDELGPPFDTRRERYEAFEKKIAELNEGDLVERPKIGTNIIIPKNELTVPSILDTIRRYSTIENVFEVISSYRTRK